MKKIWFGLVLHRLGKIPTGINKRILPFANSWSTIAVNRNHCRIPIEYEYFECSAHYKRRMAKIAIGSPFRSIRQKYTVDETHRQHTMTMVLKLCDSPSRFGFSKWCTNSVIGHNERTYPDIIFICILTHGVRSFLNKSDFQNIQWMEYCWKLGKCHCKRYTEMRM